MGAASHTPPGVYSSSGPDASIMGRHAVKACDMDFERNSRQDVEVLEYFAAYKAHVYDSR